MKGGWIFIPSVVHSSKPLDVHTRTVGPNPLMSASHDRNHWSWFSFLLTSAGF